MLNMWELGRQPTIAALVCVYLAGACSLAPSASQQHNSLSVSSTLAGTAAPAPAQQSTAPLTGLELPIGDDHLGPPVVVKVDNADGATPREGLLEADLVFEVLVEGVTRFAAVYHSKVPARVGPVRSARTTDADLVAFLGESVLVCSGANSGTLAALSKRPWLTVETPVEGDPAWQRSPERQAPHDMMVNLAALTSRFGVSGPVRPLAFRHAGPPPEGWQPVGGVEIDFLHGSTVRYAWHDASGQWLRLSHSDGVEIDGSGRWLGAENVVILDTVYQPSSVDERSPEARSVGRGDALVLSRGEAIAGGWSRSEAGSPFTLTDHQGRTIALEPGRTWFALPQPNSAALASGETGWRWLADAGLR